MLIRIDEKTIEMAARHLTCEIPRRVASLETNMNYIKGALMLLVFLTGSNFVMDFISKFMSASRP